jgi:hypothetical protein
VAPHAGIAQRNLYVSYVPSLVGKDKGHPITGQQGPRG